MKRNVAKLGGKAPTIKDIAEKLNISSVSVHRALAGKEGVSESYEHRFYKQQRKWDTRLIMQQPL